MAEIEVVGGADTEMLAGAPWARFAASTGTVFHTARFLLPWWRDRSAGNPASRLATAQVVEGGRVIGICACELDSDTVAFAGGSDVVDYMGPVAAPGREKEVAAAVTRWMFDDLPWRRARLAGLVHNDPTAQAVIDEVARLAPAATVERYDQAPRIEQAPQGYLALLNAKRRADVLRKRARLVEAVGEVELSRSTRATVLGSLERLLAWKAEAGPATREFVAGFGRFLGEMIAGLAEQDACHVVELRTAADGRPLAAAILLRHRDTVSIYNMAYDMALVGPQGQANLAPGVVLVSFLIEEALSQGLRFDFLKGAQDYKLRLGGVPVDLLEVTVER